MTKKNISDHNFLILGIGSNLGNKKDFLNSAKQQLTESFELVCESSIYQSEPVDYLDQDFFLNQVLQFKLPEMPAENVLHIIQKIEHSLGRQRIISKGPRTIDIDILFYGMEKIHTKDLIIPHPELFKRSFVVLPLKELPCYNILKEFFVFPNSFSSVATVIES